MEPLPFELIDLILEHLDELADLQSCARVSRAWCAPSQIHIFRTTSVTNGTQSSRLGVVLNESPHIASMIHTLAFKVDSQLSAVCASAILRPLEHVRSIIFKNGAWTWPGDRPHELSGTLCGPLARTLARNPLTSLTLDNFSLSNADLQDLFASAPSLKHLVVLRFCSMPFDNRPLNNTATKVSLEDLGMMLDMNSSALGEWLCHPHCIIDLTRLRSLRIRYNPDYNGCCHDIISKMLKITGQSLKELYLQRNKGGTVDGIPWKLTDNPSLESLTLDLTPHVMFTVQFYPPRWLQLMLPRLARLRRLKKLVVYAIVMDCTPAAIMTADYSDWGFLASLLGSESFPSLQLVKFLIPRPMEHAELYEEVVASVMKTLGMKWTFELSVVESGHPWKEDLHQA
ncbi:hypothetical protein D9615_005087 [Tricholomella constricta]|uniref:F-box domain-containing protein n=1 Tax=Tricholomella constricta TaxID=117010 RepID=A0A8H5HHH1_9AGAR|nr:hypothetical protein D9615_005087 [Tricholomella constricta]